MQTYSKRRGIDSIDISTKENYHRFIIAINTLFSTTYMYNISKPLLKRACAINPGSIKSRRWPYHIIQSNRYWTERKKQAPILWSNVDRPVDPCLCALCVFLKRKSCILRWISLRQVFSPLDQWPAVAIQTKSERIWSLRGNALVSPFYVFYVFCESITFLRERANPPSAECWDKESIYQNRILTCIVRYSIHIHIFIIIMKFAYEKLIIISII